jgi:hypothetical protein
VRSEILKLKTTTLHATNIGEQAQENSNAALGHPINSAESIDARSSDNHHAADPDRRFGHPGHFAKAEHLSSLVEL